MEHFADRVVELVRGKRTPAVVGLDPRPDLLPEWLRQGQGLGPAAGRSAWAAAIERFCIRVLEIVAPLVPAVKLQSAYFELHGAEGLAALRNVAQAAKQLGLAVILDAKRADIASTAEAYAQAAFGTGRFAVPGAGLAADAVTVSPYLGRDSLEPFLTAAERAGAGLFVLVHTSNAGAADLQHLPAADPAGPVYLHVAEWVQQWASQTAGQCGYGTVGAVVGASASGRIAALRDAMPAALFLVPGYGAQGGRADQIAPAFDSAGLGALVNSARAILFPRSVAGEGRPASEHDWQEAVRAALQRMIADLAAHTPAGNLAPAGS